MSKFKERKGNPNANHTEVATAGASAPREQEAETLAGLQAADSKLRQRCNSLLEPTPPTQAEWRDSNLLEMGGAGASDEELIAYWQTHRTAVELEAFEIPDLSYVKEHLAAGRNPAQEFRRALKLEELEEQEEGD